MSIFGFSAQRRCSCADRLLNRWKYLRDSGFVLFCFFVNIQVCAESWAHPLGLRRVAVDPPLPSGSCCRVVTRHNLVQTAAHDPVVIRCWLENSLTRAAKHVPELRMIDDCCHLSDTSPLHHLRIPRRISRIRSLVRLMSTQPSGFQCGSCFRG